MNCSPHQIIVSPLLHPLHPDSSLNQLKLAQLDRLTTAQIQATLSLGQKDCLKARPDATILDGHHRVYLLRMRGVDVNNLPRELILNVGTE